MAFTAIFCESVVCIDTVVRLFVEVFVVSLVLFNVVLLIVCALFACVELPFIMFRGNGFGLIMSTAKFQTCTHTIHTKSRENGTVRRQNTIRKKM